MYDPKDDVKAIIAIADCGKAFADCGTTTIEASAKFGSFLAKVFGVTIEDAAGIVGDQLKYLRWKRQNRLVDKVNEYLEKKGSTTLRPISPKFAIPFILNASLEEDDYLQDIWCQLITNALDSDFNLEIRFVYIDIIKNLTPLDAKVLEFVYNQASRRVDMTVDNYRYLCMSKVILEFHTIYNYMNVPEKELLISFENLMRVQCLRDPRLENEIHFENRKLDFLIYGRIQVALTLLGAAFVEVCMK